ncbi:MAG TPA: folylpolyglutamate synthase/dihydrofolate synthase family protein [Acidimicrobiales bacterium]|nr:folylpolyglutamate synthase/dihydrofolate synthase family protein [Acidimicrobiales bacterium]
MRRFAHYMGDPQDAQAVLHITGTNGKTSTARALTQLLISKGLRVGTYISPHLEQINERIMFALEPISDIDLAQVLSEVADLEASGPELARLNWFEVLTAAAFRYFSDRPVDAAVVEVGLGGRWDATNIATASVAVVTNVALDHTELLGPTREHIAKEKAGIIKAGSTLVLGETREELYGIFAAESPETLWWAGRDFAVESNLLAVGGRLLDLRTPGGRYDDVYLHLHGRHQADNFLAALVAAEAFFGRPLEADIVASAAAQVSSPGRMEVIQQRPVVVLDGAKNIAGAESSAAALLEEFGSDRPVVMVVGMLKGKDAREMLEALGAARARLVVTCPPPSPRAQPAELLAEAARSLGTVAVATGSVAEALGLALHESTEQDLVLVTGSLYTVGEARAELRERLGEAAAHPGV